MGLNINIHKFTKHFNKKYPQNETPSSNDSIAYPSSSLMLSEVKDIYNDENDRNKNLENKASIGITFLGVLLTVGINELDVKNLKSIKISNFPNLILALILVLALSVMVIMLVLSLYNFYQGIKTRSYNKMSTDGFSEKVIENNAQCEKDIISMDLIKAYAGIVDHNRKINDEKSKFINDGMKYLTICIISYVIYSLIYKIYLK